MSICVKNLCKRYGEQEAVSGVSFSIERGRVTGLLGANGAGKSTIMKILAGFVQATSGEAFVGGISVERQPIAAKKITGYLPEHNPLYLDMYIAEYLGFVYGIYGLPARGERRRVRAVMELTGLMPEGGKRIGQLSKGYRQRVGLAQALIHDPDVLILDEPTAGLDPNQLAEMRALIVQVGREKSVMLSTHIMQEAEAVCGSVIIVNKGRVAACDTPQNLRRQAAGAGAAAVEVALAERVEAHQWQADFIARAERLSDTQWTLYANSGEDIRPRIFRLVVQNQWTLLEMRQREKPLEEAFRTLTELS